MNKEEEEVTEKTSTSSAEEEESERVKFNRCVSAWKASGIEKTLGRRLKWKMDNDWKYRALDRMVQIGDVDLIKM